MQDFHNTSIAIKFADGKTVKFPRKLVELSPTLQQMASDVAANETYKLSLPSGFNSESIILAMNVLNQINIKKDKLNDLIKEYYSAKVFSLNEILALSDKAIAAKCSVLLSSILPNEIQDDNFKKLVSYLNVPFLSMICMYAEQIKQIQIKDMPLKPDLFSCIEIKKDELSYVSPDGQLVSNFVFLNDKWKCIISSLESEIKFEVFLPCLSITHAQWAHDSHSIMIFDGKSSYIEKIIVINLQKTNKINLFNSNLNLYGWYTTDGIKILLAYGNYDFNLAKDNELDLQWFVFTIADGKKEQISFFSNKPQGSFLRGHDFNNQCTKFIDYTMGDNNNGSNQAFITDIKTNRINKLENNFMNNGFYIWSPLDLIIGVNEFLDNDLNIYDGTTGKLNGTLHHDNKTTIQNKKNNISSGHAKKTTNDQSSIDYLVHALSKNGEKLVVITQDSNIYIWSLIDCICEKMLKLGELDLMQDASIKHITY